MYWFRDGNMLGLLLWLVITLGWWAGGWLIVNQLFRISSRERLVLGFGLGMVGYLWTVNLLGRWLPAGITFTLAAALVLLYGLWSTVRGERPWLNWRDLQAWPLLIVGLVLAIFFTRIGKGLAIFDDFKNLSIISTMAAGDIPPHFYMNSGIEFVYHYGFQLLGASMMRLGGLFPWSAFDLSKGLVWGYGVVLAYFLARRYSGHRLAGTLIPLILVFASGTRYLMLLLPQDFLAEVDPFITLQGTSAALQSEFSGALSQGWTIDGGPPIPYPFAYLNGLNPPFILAHGGPIILSIVIMLLLWQLAPRSAARDAWIPLAILLSYWGLTWESSYGLFMLGLLILILIQRRDLSGRAMPGLQQLGVAAAISIPVVLFQGGTITEFAGQAVGILTGTNRAVAAAPGASLGFSLRWPPALPSAHLGPLALTSPRELVLALLEIGPVILLTPWITRWAWQRIDRGDWVPTALVASAWAGFILPLFVAYTVDRDISRFSSHALIIWTLMLALALWETNPLPASESAGGTSDLPDADRPFTRWSERLRGAGALTLVLMCFGGVVVAGVQLTAAAQPVLSFDFAGMDARISRDYWDRLPKESEVFDPKVWRATALTGRLTRAAAENNTKEPLPEWAILLVEPSAQGMLTNGYRYVYIDEDWWSAISEEARTSLSGSCVQVLSEYWDPDQVEFRRLLDLNGCQS
jgi:hypothetical protein